MIIEQGNRDNVKENERDVSNDASQLYEPKTTSSLILPVQEKHSVLNFESLKTFIIETPTLVVKHKKFGNKKTRKVLKKINVISKLKKKSKKQTNVLEEGVVDNHPSVPTIHVESL